MRKPQRWITYILIMAIMVCSTAQVFAVDWTSTDQTNLSNAASRLIYSSRSVARWVSDVYDTLVTSNGQTTATLLNNIYSRLQYQSSINNTLSNIYLRLGNIYDKVDTITTYIDNPDSVTNTLLQKIVSAITYVGENSLIGSFIADVWQLQATYLPKLQGFEELQIALTNKYNNQITGMTSGIAKSNAHRNLFGSYSGHASGVLDAMQYSIPYASPNGQVGDFQSYWTYGTPLGNIALMLQRSMFNQVDIYKYRWAADLTGYNTQRGIKNWNTLQNEYIAPTSAIDGIYKFLANIQVPVARLSYVHASDEEIAAREKAQTNQQAVVNEFIDSNGDGAIESTSFGSIADTSKDIKTNLNTGVSASGIFDVFTGDHTSDWFSQETADSLDTTQANRSLLKANGLGATEYNTPLLDKKMNELMSIFGGDVND